MPTTPGSGDAAGGHQSVELRVDRGPRQPVRLGQVVVGGVGDVQLRGRLRQVLREGGGIRGLLDLLVQGHDDAQVVRRRVLQEGEASAPQCALREPGRWAGPPAADAPLLWTTSQRITSPSPPVSRVRPLPAWSCCPSWRCWPARTATSTPRTWRSSKRGRSSKPGPGGSPVPPGTSRSSWPT